jgi:hypothetical protein
VTFSTSQIEHLRREFAKIERVDPDSPTLASMRALVTRLDEAPLRQLAQAGIKWLSGFAERALVARGLKATLLEGDR